MRVLAGVLLLAVGASAQDVKSCLIVKPHLKRASEALFRWTQPKPFDYVEGDYPKGMKFHYEIGDKTIREIKEKGGQVVVIKPDYALADLEDARKNCKSWTEAK